MLNGSRVGNPRNEFRATIRETWTSRAPWTWGGNAEKPTPVSRLPSPPPGRCPWLMCCGPFGAHSPRGAAAAVGSGGGPRTRQSVAHPHPSPTRGAGSIRGRVVRAAPERLGRLARSARSSHPLPKVRSGENDRAGRAESRTGAGGFRPAKIGFPSRIPMIKEYRKTLSRSSRAKQENFLVLPLDGCNEALKIGISNSSDLTRIGPRRRKQAGPMPPQEGGAAGAPEHL